MPVLPILPVRHTESVSLVLCHAGLRLGEDADIFRRNPVPENYDNLVESIRHAKLVIARAEALWELPA